MDHLFVTDFIIIKLKETVSSWSIKFKKDLIILILPFACFFFLIKLLLYKMIIIRYKLNVTMA